MDSNKYPKTLKVYLPINKPNNLKILLPSPQTQLTNTPEKLLSLGGIMDTPIK